MKKILCLLVLLVSSGSFAQNLDPKLLQQIQEYKQLWKTPIESKDPDRLNEKEIEAVQERSRRLEDLFNVFIRPLSEEAEKGNEVAYHEFFNLVDCMDGFYGEVYTAVLGGLAKNKEFNKMLEKEPRRVRKKIKKLLLEAAAMEELGD